LTVSNKFQNITCKPTQAGTYADGRAYFPSQRVFTVHKRNELVSTGRVGKTDTGT